jgi:hypothetical protein
MTDRALSTGTVFLSFSASSARCAPAFAAQVPSELRAVLRDRHLASQCQWSNRAVDLALVALSDAMLTRLSAFPSEVLLLNHSAGSERGQVRLLFGERQMKAFQCRTVSLGFS